MLVPGDPVAKERPRTVRAWNERARRYVTRTYTPADTVAAEGSVAWRFRTQATRGHRPAVGDVYGLAATFHVAATRRGEGSRGAKDVDNLAKLVLDALNGVAWLDDVDVDELVLRVVRGSSTPCTDLVVYRLPTTSGQADEGAA